MCVNLVRGNCYLLFLWIHQRLVWLRQEFLSDSGWSPVNTKIGMIVLMESAEMWIQAVRRDRIFAFSTDQNFALRPVHEKVHREKQEADDAVRLRYPETRRRRERHHAATVSRVGARCLPRKRLALHPAKSEPASRLARSDWQKRDTEQCAIAHSSEYNPIEQK